MRSELGLVCWLLALRLIVWSEAYAQNCSVQEFTCATGTCVPRDSVCDFTDDCGDGSDETDSHFLTLTGKLHTADLQSPVFQPSQTCQMRFYYYVEAELGNLQVLLQTIPLGEITLVWADSIQQPRTGTWLRTVVRFTSKHSFQVVIRGNLVLTLKFWL
ncbi:hypothetical protein WMY93_030164 [Mugilogobius chulae]|uniref:MAM domain-containing protein n=1 Tax=Mugilogobius chulae TaxID=88201 RepID=A0AAW0MNV6_9GOBI